MSVLVRLNMVRPAVGVCMGITFIKSVLSLVTG